MNLTREQFQAERALHRTITDCLHAAIGNLHTAHQALCGLPWGFQNAGEFKKYDLEATAIRRSIRNIEAAIRVAEQNRPMPLPTVSPCECTVSDSVATLPSVPPSWDLIDTGHDGILA